MGQQRSSGPPATSFTVAGSGCAAIQNPGPYLSDLVQKAFVDGLHNPTQRPLANDWEDALVKTTDLLRQCENKSCTQKWYVFDNHQAGMPILQDALQGHIADLNLYSKWGNNPFRPENYRVMVYNGVRLYPWHVNRNVFPNEKLTLDQKEIGRIFPIPRGSMVFAERIAVRMKDITGGGKLVGIGEIVQLTEGRQILLSEENGGRLIQVQLVQC